MKKIFLIFFQLVVFVQILSAQRQSDWCYFGQRAGIHFTTSGPVSDTSGKLNSLYYCATYSDSSGNLLFYTNGYKVWNRQHEFMPRGDSLFYQCDQTWGGLNTPSIYGSWGEVLIIPVTQFKFYIFFNINHNYQPIAGSNYQGNGYYYYLIDMQLDSGLGDIVGSVNYINFPFFTASSLASVKHANGRDWWVIGQEISDTSSKFITLLVSPYGISGPLYQDLNSQPLTQLQSGWAGAQTVFSNDGNKMLHMSSFGVLEMFDFDRCTGELSNYLNLTDPQVGSPNTDHLFLGCSLSPDGSVVYYSNDKYLMQIHSIVGENNFIRDTIWTNTECFFVGNCYVLGHHMLANNNKIYMATSYYLQPQAFIDSFSTHLCVINSPNNYGQSCDFQPWAISTGNRITWRSLPNMPNWNLGPIDGSECDTLGIDNGISEHKKNAAELIVYPNPSEDELTVEVLRQAPDDYIGTSQHDINSIEIINALGVTVIKLKQTKPIQQLNIKSLAAGVYFVKVQMQNGDMQVRKFIKQ